MIDTETTLWVMRSMILPAGLLLLLCSCGGAPFTASDPLATPDAGTAETTDVVTDVAADDGAATEADSGSSFVAPDAAASDASATTDASGGGWTCTPGATQCTSDTQVQTCGTSGQWGTATTCTYACTGGNCGGACVPNSTQCSSDTQVQTCDGTGTWQAATACANACVSGNCGGDCVPGATRCFLIGISGSTGQPIGEVEPCGSNGTWPAEPASGETLCYPNVAQ
jgi:hypothetical protein